MKLLREKIHSHYSGPSYLEREGYKTLPYFSIVCMSGHVACRGHKYLCINGFMYDIPQWRSSGSIWSWQDEPFSSPTHPYIINPYNVAAVSAVRAETNLAQKALERFRILSDYDRIIIQRLTPIYRFTEKDEAYLTFPK